jgi:polyisoprenoid-binding protein YceI
VYRIELRKIRHSVIACCLLGGLFLASNPALAEPVEYRIDPDHLSIGFLVDHIGYAATLGMFRKAEGSFRFDEATGEMTDLRVVVDTASVFTNHKKRDDHLRNADFLNAQEFPEMIFTAATASPKAERRYEVIGQLELLGQSRPLTLDVTWNKSGEYPFGGGVFGGKPYVMGLSARGSFKRSAYGMNYGVDNGWVGDEVQLIIEFEAIRQ